MSQLNDKDENTKKVVSRSRLRQRYAGLLAIAFPLIGAMGLGGADVVEEAKKQPVATIIVIIAFVLVGVFLIILSTRPDPKGEAEKEEQQRAQRMEAERIAEEQKKEDINKYLE